MSTGRSYRNARLRSAARAANVNTNARNVLNEAIDNTDLYNKIAYLGQEANNSGKQMSQRDRLKYGDKDMRSLLAKEKLRVANDVAGGGYTNEELVDMLNETKQQGQLLIDGYNNDPRMAHIHQLGAEGFFADNRPARESSSFVGEGQFGAVYSRPNGLVSKYQAPLVEWGGYEDGTVLGRNIGKLYDYRDVADEVIQNHDLSKSGITPGVEGFTINPDGSTEVLMKDLRPNYRTGQEFYDEVRDVIDSGDRQAVAQAFKDQRLFNVKRRQQEASAAYQGYELHDRHENNVMQHKMTGRPLQIDPSGTRVFGSDQSAAVAQQVNLGFRQAGLEDEADIFVGIFNEMAGKGDIAGMKDMAQQGLSRLMKIKKVAGDNYQTLFQPPTASSGEWFFDDSNATPSAVNSLLNKAGVRF